MTRYSRLDQIANSLVETVTELSPRFQTDRV